MSQHVTSLIVGDIYLTVWRVLAVLGVDIDLELEVVDLGLLATFFLT